MKFADKGLRRFAERGQARGLNPGHVNRIRRLLTALQDANRPADLAHPSFRLHPLKGQRSDEWSMRVSDNWRIVFRFQSGEAVDIDLIDYH